MKSVYHENIPAELARVRPLHDFVLVKRLPEDADNKGLIWLPQTRQNRELGARRGTVLACGPGDKAIEFFCDVCCEEYTSTINGSVADCPNCGSSVRHIINAKWKPKDMEIEYAPHGAFETRRPMHCAPGDEILYVRAPANDIKINGEEYTFLHEEQHVLAVLEVN